MPTATGLLVLSTICIVAGVIMALYAMSNKGDPYSVVYLAVSAYSLLCGIVFAWVADVSGGCN